MYTPAHAYHTGANAYSRIGTESGAMSASPHQLICMLFDGAKTALIMARHHMAAHELAAKGKAISKAIDIVELGLKASLDADAGGAAGAELVERLTGVYDYVCQRLLQANLRNDPTLLDEAERLLDAIGSAWREIGPQPSRQPQTAAAPAGNARLSVGV